MPWWSRFWKSQPELSRGRAVQRVKTYSAESGHVYQYSFSGFRQIRRSEGATLEYVFQVSSGRVAFTPISVLLQRSTLENWAARHQRPLGASERFGLAKMALKGKLDEWGDPLTLPLEVWPDLERIEAISHELDF